MRHPIDNSLADIAAALRDGVTSAREIAEEAIARHDKWGDQIAAYRDWRADEILAQADAADEALRAGQDKGPLQGLPISVKDIFGAEGYRTFAGSPKALPPEYERDGPMVTAVREQQGVITGKTHTVEFAYGGLGTNDHWGTPRNPWDSENHRVPGGSSAGAGTSLMEGSALIAFGTDTGGSVRAPASMTGTAGLKTTAGRWPTEGIVPLSSTLDTPGILTRTVADLAYGFAAFDPRTDSIPRAADISRVRIGITADYFWERCQPDIAAVVQSTLDELKAAGAAIVEMPFPEAQAGIDTLMAGGIVAAEGRGHLETRLPGWLETLQPGVATRMEDGMKVTAADYAAARLRMTDLNAAATERLSNVDVLAVPTVPMTPPTLDDVADLEDYKKINPAMLSHTMPGNVLGLCAVSLPVGLDGSGMPVGLQLMARPFAEEALLSASLAIENVLGNSRERLGRPPLGGIWGSG